MENDLLGSTHLNNKRSTLCMYLVAVVIVDRESCKSWLMCPTLEKNYWSGKTTVECLFFGELPSPSDKEC